MYLVLLGAPGAGKGTQAGKLAKTLGLAHVASGDLFRDNIKRGTALGKQAQGYIDRGELVPDDVTVQMTLARLEDGDCADGAILDGFPRTYAQAQALDNALAQEGKAIDCAILIQVSDDELLNRLGGRWICRVCQTPYHVVHNPPKTPGLCDLDGGDLYQRQDDSLETARNRLSVYHEQTAPLIQYYRDRNKLKQVDGQQSLTNVQQALLQAVNECTRNGSSPAGS